MEGEELLIIIYENIKEKKKKTLNSASHVKNKYRNISI
jgi:hypothetical protein